MLKMAQTLHKTMEQIDYMRFHTAYNIGKLANNYFLVHCDGDGKSKKFKEFCSLQHMSVRTMRGKYIKFYAVLADFPKLKRIKDVKLDRFMEWQARLVKFLKDPENKKVAEKFRSDKD